MMDKKGDADDGLTYAMKRVLRQSSELLGFIAGVYSVFTRFIELGKAAGHMLYL